MPWLWLIFAALVGALIVLDLGVLTRRPRAVSPREGVASLGLWFLAAVGFCYLLAYVYEQRWVRVADLVAVPWDHMWHRGADAWLQFMTCYVLELALSLDNIAVLAVLFAFYKVPRELLARTLFWGILLGLFARLAMILGGSWALQFWPEFKWVLGGLLIFAMLRTLLTPDESTNFDSTIAARMVRAILPVSDKMDSQRVLTRTSDGRLAVTPIFMVVAISSMLDATFALDSVPALFSVTKDPLVAFSASAFAVLGLRSMYFALSGVIGRFRYFKVSIVAILVFVAAKVLLAEFGHEYLRVPTIVTLAVVSGVMMLGIGASMLRHRAWVLAQPSQAIRPSPLEDLSDAVDATRRNLRKVMILIAGTSIILFGIIIAPLPGPGPTVLIPIGLALLATEFVWAKRLLDHLKSGVFNVSDRADSFVDRTSVWIIPLFVVGYWLVMLGVLRGIFHLGWLTIAVVAGSPFMPIAIWVVSYARKYLGRSASRTTPPTPPPPSSDAVRQRSDSE